MRALPWIVAGVMAVVALVGWIRPQRQAEPIYTTETLTVRDTVRDTVPRPLLVRFDRYDTLRVYIRDTDTLTVRDSIYVPVPIERREYLTDDYRAVVSGWHPRLELMEVYRKTRTVTVTPEPKRWGLGIQAGVGYPSGWYVGVGVSYDLWQW